jgi:hypothetical protein
MNIKELAASNAPVTTKALAAAWLASPLYGAGQSLNTPADAVVGLYMLNPADP